ncbi:hypothetical protein PC114_g17507 [Phytophthora cactorum]|nr:hypothetical protein PC114_g17507 [Phytophthora cactorum]
MVIGLGIEHATSNLGYLRRIRGITVEVESGESAAILDATEAQRMLEEPHRKWYLCCQQWHGKLNRSLHQISTIEEESCVNIRSVSANYQDGIEGLRRDKNRLVGQLDDARTQNRMLQTRVDSSTFDPCKLRGRLHGLLEYFTHGEDPPEDLDWDTIISITAMDQRKALVPKYPSAKERAE